MKKKIFKIRRRSSEFNTIKENQIFNDSKTIKKGNQNYD